jgi:hypothetical protein
MLAAPASEAETTAKFSEALREWRVELEIEIECNSFEVNFLHVMDARNMHVTVL